MSELHYPEQMTPVEAVSTRDIWLDPAEAIFAHHFPERPILPGSYVLRLALVTAAEAIGLASWQMLSLERMTFRQSALPGITLRVAVTRAAGPPYRLSFTANAACERIAEGAFTLVEAGAP